MSCIAKFMNVHCTVTGTDLRLKLKNQGKSTITKGDWAIYFYCMNHLRISVMHMNLFSLSHVVGSLFKLDPSVDFYDMVPDSSLEVLLISSEPFKKIHEMFPLWYVCDNEGSYVIESTKTMDFVTFLDNSSSLKRSQDNIKNTRNYEDDKTDNQESFIIPTPSTVNLSKSKCIQFGGDQPWKVCGDCKHINLLKANLCINISVKNGIEENDSEKYFIKCIKSESFGKESYFIELNSDLPCITITSGSSAGEFYAIQSLLSLVSACKNSLPSGFIKDSPRFDYRGLHIDVSRNFHSVDKVIRIIKAMAIYKLNKLHLHLTDDEGWRIEIDSLPELTEVGGYRAHNGDCLKPQLGSGPFQKSSGTGSGYYSISEYKQILEIAEEHHVLVIPEIDMPGHCFAAIKAMQVRHDRLLSEGKTKSAVEYLPIDNEDPQSKESVQMYDKNVLNPCVDGTWRFIEHVIVQLKKMHEDIQPLEVFHIGGDEVPENAWRDSKVCQKYFNKKDFSKEAQELFVKKTCDLCRKHGIKAAVWSDGIPSDSVFNENSPDLVVAWRISQKNESFNPYRLANSGHKVVIAAATHLYFDHSYEDIPEERGLFWAAKYIDTKKVFNMKPMDMYSCLPGEIQHESIVKTDNIIGMQAHIWSELIRSEEDLHYMLFPRLLAFAERSWHQIDDKDRKYNWENFAKKVVSSEFPRLDDLNIKYRLSPPIVRCVGGKICVETKDIPNLQVVYKSQQSENWNKLVQNMNGNEFKNGKYYFASRSNDKKRFSRIKEVEFPIKPQ